MPFLPTVNLLWGREVKELEERLAEFAGVKHCLSCGSGTMALELLFLAFGFGPAMPFLQPR